MENNEKCGNLKCCGNCKFFSRIGNGSNSIICNIQPKKNNSFYNVCDLWEFDGLTAEQRK
jgi:hypothetical protein